MARARSICSQSRASAKGPAVAVIRPLYLAESRKTVSMAIWRSCVVRDTSRPLMLYQVVPLPHLYAVKQGYDVVLLPPPRTAATLGTRAD